MNIENVKKLVRQLRNENYRDVVAALVVYERLDYFTDEQIEKVDEKDIYFLKKIIENWFDCNDANLLNEVITNDIEEREEEED